VRAEVRDRRFNEIIDQDAGLERVATGFEFTEGPVWHPYERFLIFSDILGDCMYRWSPVDGVSVFRQPSHMANGNTYDRQGRLLTCEHATSRLTRTGRLGGSARHPEQDREIDVVASHYQGRELNSPNDVVVRSDGAITFTDPNSGRGPRFGVPREQALPFQGVYRVDPDDGSLTLLVDDFAKPNGLCFSLDEERLFVNDSDCFHIRFFEVESNGNLTNGRVWAEVRGEGVGVPDGMKVDGDGNLYCCGPGGIHVFDPHATCLGVVQMPEYATNLAWGDDDLHSLYITASTSLYRLPVNVAGLRAF
jgi:gluconolactonase